MRMREDAGASREAWHKSGARDAHESRATHVASSSRERCNPHRPSLPGAFQMLYESRDGRFCLFEGVDGHLSAVDASKFA